ncbi:MAG: FAD-binding oxidoreductase [Thermoanaerobaculia bacterium]|nr:FAD-binding oxidoreductase [Thermoanaerobaculia bacterium]
MSPGLRTPAPQLSGWGRLPVPGREIRSEDLAGVARSRPLTRGLGRSYGDASLPPAGALEVAGSALADRLLAFDPETGVLRAEAGLSLREILRLFLPRGFWPPASPGTAFVTLGGMVAADVHGKSHHRDGTFGRHVRSLRVLLADGRVVDCDRETHPGLFRATLGGMGLTGHILEVELTLQRIPSAWIIEERRRYDGLDALLAALRAAAADWPYTVAWIDTLSSGSALGRGILFAGRWAEAGEAPLFPPPPRKRRRFPLDLPEWCLSPFAVKTFNALLYGTAPTRAQRRLLSPEQFFYPLDVIEDWNRMYGRRGFTQYQCVLPESERPGATRRFLELMIELGGASFLSVLKDMGAEGEGMLSFPRPGVTVAVDLPIRPGTAALVARLNRLVADEGGRIYLAKDALSTAADFARLEPRLPAFLAERARWDPQGRLGSALSDRLFAPAARGSQVS